MAHSQPKGPQGVWWQDGVDGVGPLQASPSCDGLRTECCDKSGIRRQSRVAMLVPQVSCVQATAFFGRKPATKVLSMLQEPTIQNQSEEEVWHYPRHFIGNMTVDQLCTFLRFVTGSFVITVPTISVSFNSLDGLARHRRFALRTLGSLARGIAKNTVQRPDLSA